MKIIISSDVLIWEGNRVYRRLVRVEQAKVPLDLLSGLPVLVEHSEHVRLQHPGPLGRAPPDVVDHALVVRPRVLHARAEPAGGRPPGLRHDDPDAGRAGLLQRRVDGIHHGVEQVRVREPVAGVPHRGARPERRVVEADVARVVPVGEVGVHVGQQRPAGARQVPRDVRHVALRERAAGGREGVGEHVHPDRRRHLDAVEAGRHERVAHVPHGREEDPRGVGGGHLVADGDVPDDDVPAVGLHVGLHPGGGRGGAAGEAADVVHAADVEDEGDGAAAERVESGVVGGVDAHCLDVVGLVELHHVRARGQVVAEHAVADTVHTSHLRKAVLRSSKLGYLFASF
jgi:hypothetical protein